MEKMTPDEWRKKHKCCVNCIYFDKQRGYCEVKSSYRHDTLRRFCKIYEAKKFEDTAKEEK